MKNNLLLLKLFLLLNGIILSTLASCPSYPTITTTSIPNTDPIVLTSASEGMISLDPSLTKLSITMTVTLDEECPSGDYWDIFTLTITPSGGSEQVMIDVFLECDTFDLQVYGPWFDDTVVSEIFPGSSRTVSVFASIDLASALLFVEANSADKWGSKSFDGALRLLESERVLQGVPSSFDETTKLYLCSWRDGADSALACTVSRLQLTSTSADNEFFGYLGDFTPVTQAFYPLTDGKLSSVIKSTDSASFGEGVSSPSWDSSKSFVQIASETQFLTLPIPSITENSIFIPTMTFAFWVRITSIPQDSATFFSVILEDGATGFSFVVSKDGLKISGVEMEQGEQLQITLNTWQLISCSLYFAPDVEFILLTLSVGNSKTVAMTKNFAGLAATKLHIGNPENSFIGDISSARILSSGAGYLTNSDTCSPNNAIEINSGPYAISCAEGFSFNPSDSKCYSSCPGDLSSVAPFTNAPFTLCLSDGSPSGSITVEESGGLSGGAIAGIAVGSVAGVALIASAGYYLIKVKAAKSAAQWAPKSKPADAETPRKDLVTTSNLVSPTGAEGVPLK